MTGRRIVMTIDMIAIAVVALLILIASARSDQAPPQEDVQVRHVDIR